MGSFIIGFIGLGLFGFSGSFQPQNKRPAMFQGRIGSILSWIVMLIGIYLVYRGWVKPWISN
jgi:hypothetical protein